MELATELQIRAEAIINVLKAQIAEAMEGTVHLQAEIAVLKAKIIELENKAVSEIVGSGTNGTT